MIIKCPNCRFSGRIPSYATGTPTARRRLGVGFVSSCIPFSPPTAARCWRNRTRWDRAHRRMSSRPSPTILGRRFRRLLTMLPGKRRENRPLSVGTATISWDWPRESSPDAEAWETAVPREASGAFGKHPVLARAPVLGDHVPDLGGVDRGPQRVHSIRFGRRSDEQRGRRLQRCLGHAPRPRRGGASSCLSTWVEAFADFDLALPESRKPQPILRGLILWAIAQAGPGTAFFRVPSQRGPEHRAGDREPASHQRSACLQVCGGPPEPGSNSK